MIETTLAALLMIVGGAVLRRLGVVRREDAVVLVKVVIWLALPALVIEILVGADLDPSLLLVPVAAWVTHLVLLPVALLIGHLMRLDRPSRGAMAVSMAVGNTGFFGLPLVAASGAGFSLPAAVMYDAIGNGAITWVSTPTVCAMHGEELPGERARFRRALRGLLLPPMWALLIGVTLNLAGVTELPAAIDVTLATLAAAVLPLVMVYAGLLLEVGGLRRVWREVAAIAVVRLGLAAVVGLAVGWALGLRGEELNTVVIMAAMPTALMSLVFGAEFRLRTDIIAGAVVVTTLLAVVTLPVVRALLT